LELRKRAGQFRPPRASGHHPPDDGAGHRRRSQQPEPAQRLGAPGDPAEGSPAGVDLSGGAPGLGCRRQRDGPLRPGVRPGGGGAIPSGSRRAGGSARARGGALMERSGEDMAGGDARTLSFAAYRIDAVLLEQLLRYQRALLDELRAGWNPATMAAAHEKALAASGLSQNVVERALAVIRRFAGNREVAGRLRARAARLDRERSGDLEERLAALDRELRERDDPPTVELLLEHEAEILDLHRRLSRLLGT